jgi:hypothetical protein
VLGTAAEIMGCDHEQLGKKIRASDAAMLQAGIAMAAADRTTRPAQIRALGKALAPGLLATDEEEADVRQRALTAMADGQATRRAVRLPQVDGLPASVDSQPDRRGAASSAPGGVPG